MLNKNLSIILLVFGYSFWLISSDHNLTDKNCNHLLHKLANNQSRFIYCVTAHSVPVNICTACKTESDEILRAYDLLHTDCSNEFFDQDRVNLVTSSQNLLNDLWARAFCDDCYTNVNKTDEFKDRTEEFYNCTESKGNNTAQICAECLTPYENLNNFYSNWELETNGKICFDVQDSMNRTRLLWSQKFKCCQRIIDLEYFSIVVTLVFILLITFYTSVYSLTKKYERDHKTLNEVSEMEVPIPATEQKVESSQRKAPKKYINNILHEEDSE